MILNCTKEELYLNGIYRIYCIKNQKSYIGSAAGFKSRSRTRNGFYCRYYSHLNKLKTNKHRNAYLQNAWNLYKEDSFVFEILEVCLPEDCLKKELHYMDVYKSMIKENGFNMIKQSLGNHTGIFTKEHRSKISKALIGRPRPDYLREKLGVRVGQFDFQGNLIKEYFSMSEASRQTGIQRQDIGQSIIGKKCKTAGGFIWKKMKT